MRKLCLLLFCAMSLGWSQVEPNGGSWKTWVLSSGSQLRLPPPPDAATTSVELEWLRDFQMQINDVARAQITYWDAGSPSYRWVQWLEQHVVNLGVNTPNATRQMALLNVAVYDAMVAAWDSKYVYKRLPPFKIDSSIQTLVTEADVPSYPNEHAVAAGAAAAVLSYLYPSEAAAIQDLAAEEARSRMFAGVALPSDYDSGLKLGNQVGQLAVQRAQSDGSNAVFTGTIPAGPGLWTGTNPVCPMCGTWKTWVLENGSQFRPGPPLPYNSPEKQAELAFLHSQTRPFNDQATAFYWQSQIGIITSWYDFVHTAIFEDHLTGNALRTARMYALMSVSQYDSMVACWDGKYTYWAIRPFQLDPTLTTLFATPNHPSYPAAHATTSTGISEIIAYLFPARAGTIRALATQAGFSREIAGIHFPSDVAAGNMLGSQVSEAVIAWAENDGSQ